MLFDAVLNSLNYLVGDLNDIVKIENNVNTVKVYTQNYISTFTINKLHVTNTITYTQKLLTEQYSFTIQSNLLIEI